MTFQPHENLLPPDKPGQKLWRYMSFAKYVDMLDTNGLWFSSPRFLGDTFEGSYARPNVVDDLESIKIHWPEAEVNSDDELAQLNDWRRNLRASSFGFGQQVVLVNCWHMNDDESAAMWASYASSGQGIAVQSTYERLSESLEDSQSETNV